MQLITSFGREIRERMLWQVSVSYLLSVWAAVQIVDTVGTVLGFPDAFTRAAFALLLAGLPVAIAVTIVARRRTATQERTTARKARLRPPMLAALGAFTVLALVTTGFVGMRNAGIGPAASLLARGAIGENDRVVLAQFATRTGDTLTAEAVTESLRIDLEQSHAVLLVDPAYVGQVLQRMERNAAASLDVNTALELAQREGFKAVLAGEINPVGRAFVLSARLLAAETGATLISLREMARDSSDVIGATGRLSKKLRERVGESLRSLRATPSLPQVTTRSLSALRKYAQARAAIYVEGDEEKGIALTEEAIALDSTFAMAHVQLGIALLTHPTQAARTRVALTTAFRLRDRLTEPEHYFAQAAYYDDVTHEPAKAITTYRILLDSYPRFRTAMVLNNLALLYEGQRDFRRAGEFYRRALEEDSSNFVPYINLAVAQVAVGDYDDAAATVRVMRAKHKDVPWVHIIACYLASSRWDFAEAETELRALRAAEQTSSFWRAQTSAGLAALARAQARTADAERQLRDLVAARLADDDRAGALAAHLDLAELQLWDRRDPVSGLRLVDEALQQQPLKDLAPDARPYLQLARLYASAGDTRRARSVLAEYEQAVPPELRRSKEQAWHIARALVAVAAGDTRAALDAARTADAGPCVICAIPVLGWAYDVGGQPDSARTVWRRYLATPSMFRLDETDAVWLVRVQKRLAELQ